MKNHFKIFSLPIKFELNLDLLEQKYFFFQRQFHPDSAGISEIENSIAINEAYEILKNPLRRAAHILQLNGIDIETDSRELKPDMATLEHVLEIQEKILTLDEKGIIDLKKELSDEIKLLLSNASVKLENKDFAMAAQILIKAKYFDKTLRDLKK